MRLGAKLPYYVVRERYGRRLGYWQPTPKMRALGFTLVPCGEDGPEAWAIAGAWNAHWQEVGRGPQAARQTEDGAGYVYFVRSGGRIKVGFSKQPRGRISELQTGMSVRIDPIVVVPGTRRDEHLLHRRLAAY